MTRTTLNSVHNKNNGLLMLALVVALLALPFAIAAGLYFGGWKPARTTQHGQLLNPPLALPAAGLQTPEGKPLPTAELHGKWLLVLSLDGACQAECAARIDEMRRIQVSLNKEMGRLRRVVLSGQPGQSELTAASQRQPDLLLASAPANWLDGKRSENSYRLHIIDPLGRRVMDYPAEVAAKEIRADLERLLKYAWTG